MVEMRFGLAKRNSAWIGLLVVLLGVGFVFAAYEFFGHEDEEVFVFVNGDHMTLKDAISSGEFGVDYSGGVYSQGIEFGHSASDIFVSVGGVDKDFQTAINDGSLCSFAGGAGNYSSVNNIGHVGEDVNVSFGAGKSLQAAIDAGDFRYNVWSPSAADTCTTETVVQTNCGRNRTVSGTKVCVLMSVKSGLSRWHNGHGNNWPAYDMGHNDCRTTSCPVGTQIVLTGSYGHTYGNDHSMAWYAANRNITINTTLSVWHLPHRWAGYYFTETSVQACSSDDDIGVRVYFYCK